MRPSRRALLAVTLAALLVTACAVSVEPPRQQVLRGFTPESAATETQIEALYRDAISREELRAHLEWLTSRPHLTGTENTRLTVEYIRDRLREYGWQAEIEEYVAWLTEPVDTSIELVAPEARTIPVHETPVEGDEFSQNAGEHPGWMGYSASGDVTAPIVYANHGSTEDFETLLAAGIDPAGKIVLMRNFSTGEGRKVYNAERYGAAGAILYADPEEDGYAMGPVYPEGNWRPAGSIMRRSIEYTPYSGDPLSPGFASLPGTERLSPEEVRLPGIPAVPTSYDGAKLLLEAMGGPEGPEAFQGALDTTYRLGGEATVRLRAEMINEDRPMLNVVATLEGERWPDQWITLGNHHDAWIYGAGDPSSGTAAVLEMARVLGELAADGHRPARTIVLGVWDAEEMLLGGSTEWVEAHREELLDKAVANINMDSAVFNPGRPLRVHGHAALHEIFREVAATLEHPDRGTDFATGWTADQNEYFPTPSVDGYGYFLDRSVTLAEPWIFETPSDDASPFFDYLALPATDMYYGGDYGMYHSIYENFDWMTTVVDPEFDYHRLMTQLHGLVAMRLANAEVLPMEWHTEAGFWRLALEDLVSDAAARDQRVPMEAELRAAILEWENEAYGLAEDLRDWAEAGDSGATAATDAELEAINRDLYRLARDFYRPGGTPGRPWNQNLFQGSAYDFEGASGSLLPGIRFALDEGQLDLAEAEARIYLDALRQRVEGLSSLRAAVDGA